MTKKLVEYGFVGLVIATAIIVGAQIRPANILSTNGILQIQITDDPLVVTCLGSHTSMTLTSLKVTLTSVEARTTEAVRLSGGWVPVSGETKTIDILQLGTIPTLIGSASVPESTITSVRLTVSTVAATTSLGTHPQLILSSDMLEASLVSNGQVRTGMTTSVVVDFQPHVLCEGNGMLRLTPVLTATSSGPE